jgi:hypothetical protein
MKRLVAGLALAAAVAAASGCSSSSGGQTHSSDAQQTGAGGTAALAAQPPAGSLGARSGVRLAFQASPADGVALVGVADGLFRADIGGGAGLNPVQMTSSAAAEALAQGRVDAAYLSPVAAVQAWQLTHGRIRVLAGAASAAGQSTLVLAVSERLLLGHPLWVQGLLKGQIQAFRLLTSDPASGRRLAAAELSDLGRKTSSQQFARAVTAVTFTCDPLTTSVLGQARHAAAARTLRAVGSLTAMYDLVPVDVLLRSAGLTPVSTTAS